MIKRAQKVALACDYGHHLISATASPMLGFSVV
jgi:hypothetical protein